MNNSKQANEDGCSMYLSFDAESTISSAAYKTLEGTNMDESMGDFNNSNLNITLDAAEEHEYFSGDYLTTVKKSNEKEPIALSKSAFQKFKANSSTPTKVQLAKSLDYLRDPDRKFPASLTMELDDIDYGTSHFGEQEMEENKENAHPDSEFSLSASSSYTDMTNTAIERKMPNMYTNFEDIMEEKINEKLDEDDGSEASAKIDVVIKMHKQSEEAVGELIVENNKVLDTDKSNQVTNKIQKKSILAPKTFRKVVASQPNLETNRPSRIEMDYKKKISTTAPTNSMKAISETEPINDIPHLFNKILKIGRELDDDSDEKKVAPKDKRKSTISTNLKGRSSMLPTTQSFKRNNNFPNRMSTVVKTALNSPSRKTSRNSSSYNVPTTRKTEHIIGGRKSILPIRKPQTKPTTFTGSSLSKLTTTSDGFGLLQAKGRTSLFSTTKKLEKTNMNGFSAQKPKLEEHFFVCSICKANFRVKSLLDAHKITHEVATPSFVKKCNGATSVMPHMGSNIMQQCKFCDKKFVLERTLHIHLMQNCPKIPPSEKRKLHFTEMDHVEKAQLPDFSNLHPSYAHSNSISSNGVSAADGIMNGAVGKPTHARKTSLSPPKSLLENEEITILTNKLVAAIDGDINKQMLAPTRTKVKRKTATAHAGVYRTPNKSVQCHKCKLSFKSILDHISHNMTVHGNSSTTSAPNPQNTTQFMDMDIESKLNMPKNI